MNKGELIDLVSSDTKLAKQEVNKIINSMVNILATYVRKEDVRLDPLGTFKVKTRAARKLKNIVTGEWRDIPPKQVVVYKANKQLLNK